MNKEEIIRRAKITHGDKYDLSLIKDAKVSDKITVKCEKHGEFYPRLDHFLKGSGCPTCSGKIRSTFEEFKEKASKIHNGKYQYNDTNYINAHTKLAITCPIHGDFYQAPTNHLNGNGCPKCKSDILSEKFSSNIVDFIEKSKIVHNNKYDYSLSGYVNNTTPTLIICPKHGEFWQTPQAHLSGRGCPFCRESRLEREVKKILDDNCISYYYQWHLPWAKYYSLDFYLKEYNVGIECQGIQHFEDGHFKNSKLNEIIERDRFKFNTCLKNGIKLIYYSNIENKGCITDKETLINTIKQEAIDG